MSRYIDSDLCEDYFYEHLDDNGMAGAMNAIREIPTADVRENVHGEWRRNFDGNEFYWYCTNCKTEYYEDDLYMGGNEFPNFCPKCGADMRKGETK